MEAKEQGFSKGLSFDDVLLKPKKTEVTSLSSVSTKTKIGGLDLSLPVISAPMDTVTEQDMAVEIAKQGGLGVIHRFMTVEEQREMVEKVKEHGEVFDYSATDPDDNLLVGGAIGLDDFERAEKLVDARADALVLDIAHGHHEQLLDELEHYSQKYPDICLIVGNVATKQGAKDLEKAGADVVKVGIGPGSACTTREMTGAGVPQITAILDCANAVDIDVIADGGIRKPGDLAKALMAGADAGMIGGLLGGTKEAPGKLVEKENGKYKVFRGMSSEEAAKSRNERTSRGESYSDKVPEGINTEIKYKGAAEKVLNKLQGGLKSSISYCGRDNLSSARENSEFIQITGSTQQLNSSHINT